jgi:hypothetical protein
MASRCYECGAPVAEGVSCIDHFHALLLLEREVVFDPTASNRGEVVHFYAVSSYVLQHPEAMSYTAEALAAARRNMADHLAGEIGLAELRNEIRRAVNGSARIMRRPGVEAPRWPVTTWPLTVSYVLSGGAQEYVDRVIAWAESIIRTLDGADP